MPFTAEQMKAGRDKAIATRKATSAELERQVRHLLANGLTQTQIAHKLGKSKQTISRIKLRIQTNTG